MINFFRKTRKKLADDNKFFKYSRYAIGEIVLVVIGILIALQINNWNEEQKENQKEQGLLKELHLDFEYNKMQLDSLTINCEIGRLGNERLLNTIKLIERKHWDINNLEQEVKDSLKQYFIEGSYKWTFNPKSGTINSIINSSTLDIITNDSLRRAIISWNDVLGDYLEDEREHTKVLDDYYAWSRINFIFTEDEFSADNIDAFFSIEHQNFIQELQWTLRDLLASVKDEGVIDLVDTIVALTEKDIKK